MAGEVPRSSKAIAETVKMAEEPQRADGGRGGSKRPRALVGDARKTSVKSSEEVRLSRPNLVSYQPTSVGPAAVPVSVVRAVRDAGSARQSGPLICILVLGCRRSSISTHMSHQSVTSVKAVRGTHQSVTSVKAVVARGAVAACNGAATRSGRPRQPTHHAQWELENGRLSRTIGHRAANTRRTDGGGGRIPHTPEQHRHLTRQRSLDVAALSPRSYLAVSTAACGHAPRRAGLGGRPRSRTRCGHARWLRWLRA